MKTSSDHPMPRVMANGARRGLTLATLLLAMSAAACAANGTHPSSPPSAPATATSNVKQLSGHDDGTTVHIRVGDSVAITLPENPTTGYTWTIDDGSGALLKAAPPQRERSSGAIGAGGHVSFAFVAQAPGKGTISLKHSRPWEDPATAIGRFSVSVVIEPQPAR